MIAKLEQTPSNAYYMGESRGGQGSGPPPPPPEKSQNIEFLCNTGPDPQKNYIATKPAFNVGPSSARQRHAISMFAFQWRVAGGPMMAQLKRYLDLLSPIN